MNSIEQVLPRELKYERIIPKGFPCVFKQWEIDPSTNNKHWSKDEVVRFNFMNSSTGVYDPYRSYIEITVSVQENFIGLLQIDNSAQSFIQNSVLFSNNRQIERIAQYGVLAHYLNDIGLNQSVAEGRQDQGLGYGSFDTMPFIRGSQGSSTTFSQDSSGSTLNVSQINTAYSMGLTLPTQGITYIPDQSTNSTNRYAALKTTRGHVTTVNPFIQTNTKTGGDHGNTALWKILLQNTGFYSNMRTEYLANFQKNNFIESTSSSPLVSLTLDQSVFKNGGVDVSTATTFKNPQNISGQIYYLTGVPETVKSRFVFGSVSYEKQHHFTTSNFGFTNLFSPAFSRGTFQPFISQTVRQCMLYNGKILKTKEPLVRRTFKIPLLSGVIGVLIQPSQYMLLPLKSISSLLLEINLDQYAMFTSGYMDIGEFDTAGMLRQQPRSWNVDNIQLKAHTYHFSKNQVNNYIQTSLFKEINFVTNMWSLGNRFQIGAGMGPSNSYIVSSTSKNLNQIVCLFNTNDHQIFSFCRKHYRLSNNITRFQVKMGVDYWPFQPYRGNGGNPCSNEMNNNNSKFIENIYFANNHMFSQSSPLPRINIYNFALNERPYNPQNRQTFYSSELLNDLNYQFTDTSVNADTALGMSWIHENRAVGKAAYLISFSPYSDEQNLIRGVDVSSMSNFEVIIQSQSSDNYPKDQTLFIFCRSSVLVSFGMDGINTYGR